MTGKSFGVAEFRWRAPNTGSPDRTGAGRDDVKKPNRWVVQRSHNYSQNLTAYL